MKKSELKQLVQVVRFIVQEELKKELPRVVESVLTEKYLRKLVAESAPARSPRLAEVMGDELRPEEELQNEPPEVLRNDHEGIYQKNPLTRKQRPEKQRESLDVAAKLLAGNDPALAGIFEGIDTRSLSEMKGGSDPKDIPLEAMAGKLDFGRMNELLGNSPEVSSGPSAKEAKAMEERQERMLEMRRRALEVPVNGGKVSQPQPRRVISEAPVSDGRLDVPPFEPVGVLS